MLTLLELVEDNQGRSLFNYEDFATDYANTADIHLGSDVPANKFIASPINQPSLLSSVFHQGMMSATQEVKAQVSGPWKFKVSNCVVSNGSFTFVVYDGLICEEEPDKFIILSLEDPCSTPGYDFAAAGTTQYEACGCWTTNDAVQNY